MFSLKFLAFFFTHGRKCSRLQNGQKRWRKILAVERWTLWAALTLWVRSSATSLVLYDSAEMDVDLRTAESRRTGAGRVQWNATGIDCPVHRLGFLNSFTITVLHGNLWFCGFLSRSLIT